MKRLLKNGTVINVFTGECLREDVLLCDEMIVGVGDYSDVDADEIYDVSGKYLCPGFIDGHIHIESSMLTPLEFARVSVPHGTTSIFADPHEIANVCGTDGIRYMLEASEGLPMTVYLTLPSCVPSTPFDESGAVLPAEALSAFYSHPRVRGLGEVMSYPAVIARDPDLMQKIADAKAHGMTVNGHAPLLSGKALDRYVSAGIYDDHECSSFAEAKERIRKGQWLMIRQGTAARNLSGLMELFQAPWCERCLLVTDDKHPADLLSNGHIDDIIRQAVRNGADPVTGIRMATLHAAQCFGLRQTGAIAPGYTADLLVLSDLSELKVETVFRHGTAVAAHGVLTESGSSMKPAAIPAALSETVRNSFRLAPLSAEDFHIPANGVRNCRVIGLLKDQLLTEERCLSVDFDRANGTDPARDLLKIAVCERHHGTGHRFVGLIQGAGLKRGAVASSVSHDAHNLIIIGTNEADMAAAGNRVREMGGGLAAAENGVIAAELPLPLGGLMSDQGAETVAAGNEAVRKAAHALGVPEGTEIFMPMAFLSLPVIPHLKITTTSLVDVDRQETVGLFL